MHRPMERRFPVGAEPLNGGVSFRVWAPDHDKVELVADGRRISMHREAEGYWTAFVPGMAAGTRYQFALNADLTLPDPVSRFQPHRANGPSMVVDPVTFQWTDTRWTGPLREAVYYELHIGTFTPEGTFAAAAKKLQWLKDLGVTVIEIMPLNTCAGSFGWGYDGILLFAPMASYGNPDDVRRFVDQAHALARTHAPGKTPETRAAHEVCYCGSNEQSTATHGQISRDPKRYEKKTESLTWRPTRLPIGSLTSASACNQGAAMAEGWRAAGPLPRYRSG